MSLTLRVTIEVVDTESGEPVNEFGTRVTNAKQRPPLKTQIPLRQYSQVINAHRALNQTHALIKNLGEIMQ